jgi:hypothetical protein
MRKSTSRRCPIPRTGALRPRTIREPISSQAEPSYAATREPATVAHAWQRVLFKSGVVVVQLAVMI